MASTSNKDTEDTQQVERQLYVLRLAKENLELVIDQVESVNIAKFDAILEALDNAKSEFDTVLK